ncbi:MAG TPA: hypothetical protein VGH80_11690 [Xanthomonadaceae bacterium]|jgi:hypothetical protein
MKVSAVFGMLIGSIHPRLRLALGILYGSSLLPTAVLLLAHDTGMNEIQAVTLFSMATAGLWGMVAGGSMMLIQDAHALRLPSLVRPLLAVALLLFAVTVLLPAAVFGLTRGIFPLLLAQLACTALAGTLWAQLPGRLNAAIFCAVLLLTQTPLYSCDLQAPAFLSKLCLLLGMLSLWRWVALRRALRDSEPGAQASWRSPALLHMRSPPEAASQGGGKTRDSGPHHYPVAAMRTWLGAPFAPKAWYLSLRDFGLVVLTFVLMVLILPDFEHLDTRARFLKLLPTVMPIWILVTTQQFCKQLHVLHQRHGGELAELALVPGWGGAVPAGRMLLSAVFQPIGAFFFGALLVLETAAFALGLDTMQKLLIASVVFGVAAATATYCLRNLAALPSWSRLTLLLGLIGLPLTVVSLRPLDSSPFGISIFLLLSWAAVCLLQGWAARQAYDAFRARPHPFLTE